MAAANYAGTVILNQTHCRIRADYKDCTARKTGKTASTPESSEAFLDSAWIGT